MEIEYISLELSPKMQEMIDFQAFLEVKIYEAYIALFCIPIAVNDLKNEQKFI